MIKSDAYFSGPDTFHSTSSSSLSPTVSQTARFYSGLWMNHFPLYVCTIFSLPLHTLIDTWVFQFLGNWLYCCRILLQSVLSIMWKISILLSMMTLWINTSTSFAQMLHSLHIVVNSCCISLFKTSLLLSAQWHFSSINCHFSNEYCCCDYFIYLLVLGHLHGLFQKCIFISLDHFKYIFSVKIL